MNSKGEFFKVQFFLSGLWRRGKRCVLQLITLLLLLGCVQAAFAMPTTPTGDFIDNQDGTVTHKTTGLAWMRCALGQKWTGSSCSGTASTYTYDQAVALKRSFAGHSDWRVPNIAELQTIVERGNYNPANNTEMFPNTPSNSFWSSSPRVGYTDFTWLVDFYYGVVSVNDRYYSFPVRLVRASQSLAIGLSTPNTDFTDNKDGTVTHKRTGLVWQRCAVGQTWTGSTCSGSADVYSYDQAIALTSSLAGRSDWRVPNANELASIVKYDASYPAINTTLFPNTLSNAFWSSSPNVGYTGAWYVSFYIGVVGTDDRYDSLPVRLVRSLNRPSLTVIKKGSGTGTVSSNPKGIMCGTTCFNGFSSGKKVTLSATPDATSVFVRWEGDCTGTQTSCTVTVNKGKTVTAVFDSTLPTDSVVKLRSYQDDSKKFVFSKKIIEQTTDHVTADVRLISGTGCWYMATPNFTQTGSPILSKADVYYLAPYGNIVIDNNLRFEPGQYYQLDVDRWNVGAQTLVALDVILRGIFSKRLEDVITNDKEKISLFIDIVKESARVSGLDTGTAYLLAGEYMNASKEYIEVMKELADSIGHDRMQELFTSVLGQSGKAVWNRGIGTLLEIASLPDKYYLEKEIIDNYVTNPCPLDGYVQLKAE
jgi:hypothetical protein